MSGHWLAAGMPWLDRLCAGRGDRVTDERADPLAADKRRLAEMARQRRAKQQQAAEAAFQAWLAERHRHAAKLFADLHGEDRVGFPPPTSQLREARGPS